MRDLAAFRRGLDFRHLAGRYREWQLVTNTQGVRLFFETVNGKNLHDYPRGVAAWRVFEAIAGQSHRDGHPALMPGAGPARRARPPRPR